MKKKPLISVIIPCYNADKFLEQAILSIINQTYKELEILIIDDGSVDNSKLIYDDFAKKDSRISILKNETNLGLIATLNKGISHTNGEFIARMDADDISLPDRLEKQIDFLLKNTQISIVGSKALAINEQGKELPKNNSITYTESNTLKFSSYFSQPLFHGSVVAHAEVLKKNKYSKDFKHSEDFELWLRLLSQGYKIANVDVALYCYRNNPDGVSNNNASFQSKMHNSASKKYLEILMKKELDIELVSILNNRPQKEISVDSFSAAIQLFYEIINTASFKDSKEFRQYCTRQKIDIVIQALKKAKNLSAKVYFSLFLTRRVISKTGSNYLLKKFRVSNN